MKNVRLKKTKKGVDVVVGVEKKINEVGIQSNELGSSPCPSIVRALAGFRGLSDEINNYPKKTIKEVLDNITESGTFYFPCDIVELRQILVDDQLYHVQQVVLFSLPLIKKYLLSYPLFLGINLRDKDYMTLGGIVFIDDPSSLLVKDNLKSILLREDIARTLTPKIDAIIRDTGTKVETSSLWMIPSLTPRTSKRKNQIIRKANILSAIPITNEEETIFSLLRDVNRTSGAGVEMRVCGGWVRDKLLGKESDDIDIAISKMSGIEFAKLIHNYSVSKGIQGVEKPYEVSLDKVIDKPAGDGGQTNLMVGGISIDGQKIEIVPMRTEKYDPNSRKPTIVRTDDVKEDVRRRDLTINSLYYNIETGKVEDYVNGIQDLKEFRLNTPDDPTKTFIEDPLRVLRVIRFNSKFPGSTIEPRVLAAMSSEEVKDAYTRKVAPQRAGKEFMKMMSGPNVSNALRVLLETGFYKTVFDSPEVKGLRDIKMEQQNDYHKLNVMEHTLMVIDNLNRMMTEANEPDEVRGLMNMAAFFHDWGKLNPEIQQPHPTQPGKMSYHGHEDVSLELADSALKNIGLGENERAFVTKVVGSHMTPNSLANSRKEQPTNKSIGKFLRKLEVNNLENRSDTWRDLFGRIWRYVYMHNMADLMSKGEGGFEDDVSMRQQHVKGIENYLAMQGLNPEQSVSKPILNGNDIITEMQELDPKTGFINEVQRRLLEEQDDGMLKDKNDALIWLRSIKPEIIEMYGKKTNSSSWYNRIKVADASSDQGPEGFQGSETGTDTLQREQGQNRIDYSVEAPFSPGDEVRERKPGIGENQASRGRVVGIGDNKMLVEWLDGPRKDKVSSFNLLDAAQLALTLEKVR